MGVLDLDRNQARRPILLWNKQMIYVLIMVVAYGTNTAAVTTQEFSSKEK